MSLDRKSSFKYLANLQTSDFVTLTVDIPKLTDDLTLEKILNNLSDFKVQIKYNSDDGTHPVQYLHHVKVKYTKDETQKECIVPIFSENETVCSQDSIRQQIQNELGLDEKAVNIKLYNENGKQQIVTKDIYLTSNPLKEFRIKIIETEEKKVFSLFKPDPNQYTFKPLKEEKREEAKNSFKQLLIALSLPDMSEEHIDQVLDFFGDNYMLFLQDLDNAKNPNETNDKTSE